MIFSVGLAVGWVLGLFFYNKIFAIFFFRVANSIFRRVVDWLVFDKKKKNYDTQYSHVVPHHSTDCAITSLTSEIGRDPVLSSVYGRNQQLNVETLYYTPHRYTDL